MTPSSCSFLMMPRLKTKMNTKFPCPTFRLLVIQFSCSQVSLWWDIFVKKCLNIPSLILPNPNTGITVTGHAVLDVEGSEAVLTVDPSDEPYGLLTIASSSLRVNTEEQDQTINIYVTREFGALGL